jgi:molybdopterin-guanine dinucleotide biosynthesis protein A
VFDAIVLAGGAARRLGGIDKVAEPVAGIALLDRVLRAAGAARRTVVVGPRRDVSRNVVWRREIPAGAGPVAAIAAGMSATSAPTVVVLAADLPEIGPAVPVLLNTVDAGADVALLVDSGGRTNYLAGAWRRKTLQLALRRVGDPANAPMRTLVEAADNVALVPDPAGWGRDCDTWEDLAAARQRVDDLAAARQQLDEGR